MALIQQRISPVDDQLSGYIPVRIVEVELKQPLPTLSVFDEKKGCYYQRARCLVRLHTQPLGLVELTFDKDELSPDEYAPKIWLALNEQINDHLRQDGFPPVTELTANGLPDFSMPPCKEKRERFFATAPFVSVIVPTHNRPERLSVCLLSLLSQYYPHYEVIVVDNAPSTNATADLIKQLSSDEPRLHYTCEDRPGPSWARNLGIAVARGKILAFTDDDVVVDSHWLLELIKAFSIADEVACVTGLVLPLELETRAQFLFEEHGGFSRGFTRRIYDMAENRPKEHLYPYTAGRFGSGASMAFTTAFLGSVGGFDPALGGNGPVRCGQDIALFFQVVLHKYKLVYEPAAIAYHLHRRDYVDLRKQISNYGIGLTAHLTKGVLENPRLLFEFVTRVPYGFFFTLSARSPRNKKKSAHYPKELTIIELKGMLYGPLAYILSRRALGWTHKEPMIVENYSNPFATRESLASGDKG